MDYEHKIRVLEEEVRHWRNLKALHDERLDAHDRSIAAIHEILARTAKVQYQIAEQQAQTDRMLRDLIQALTPHSNGKS